MLEAFFCAIGFNILMFFPAYFFKTDKLTDISYALSFVLISIYLLFKYISTTTIVDLVLYFMISIWALRLGSYLLYRIQKIKRDKRFDKIRSHFWKFLRFWLLQGFAVFIIFIPSIFVFRGQLLHFKFLSVFGIIIFGFGLIYESVADWQKFKFILKSKSTTNFIHSGLWFYSRHPNYFGEICVWLGIYLYCICYVNGFLAVIGIISPLFLFVLLRYVSGIPLLEKSAQKKLGKNKTYLNYVKSTPLLLPNFWKKGK